MLRSRSRSPARRSRHDSGDLIHTVREERRKRERRSRRSRSRSRSRSPRSRRGRSRSKKRHSNSKSSSRSRSNSRASGDDKEKNKKEKSKDTSEKKENGGNEEGKVSTENSFIFTSANVLVGSHSFAGGKRSVNSWCCGESIKCKLKILWG